jgi:hypothetical protein
LDFVFLFSFWEYLSFTVTVWLNAIFDQWYYNSGLEHRCNVKLSLVCLGQTVKVYWIGASTTRAASTRFFLKLAITLYKARLSVSLLFYNQHGLMDESKKRFDNCNQRARVLRGGNARSTFASTAALEYNLNLVLLHHANYRPIEHICPFPETLEKA